MIQGFRQKYANCPILSSNNFSHVLSYWTYLHLELENISFLERWKYTDKITINHTVIQEFKVIQSVIFFHASECV